MSEEAKTKSGLPSWAVLIGFLVLSAAVASLGGIFSPGPQYAELNKPSWTPPAWLFGPVWTGLYTAMAVAAWRIWKHGQEHVDAAALVKRALIVYVVQLILNALWSPLFFGAGNFGLALVDIVLMWLAILVTIVLFWRLDRLASILLWPYLAWVSFATVLNAAMWSLNPGGV